MTSLGMRLHVKYTSILNYCSWQATESPNEDAELPGGRRVKIVETIAYRLVEALQQADFVDLADSLKLWDI